MGPRDIDIHHHPIRKAGDDLEAAARHARQRLSHSLDSSDTVSKNHAHGGWTSAKELEECAQAWESHMIGLVKEMGSLGEGLRAASKGHQSVDGYVDGLLHGIRDLGRP
jgi:hypothetical protein